MRSKIFTRTVGYWPLQESSGQALDYSGNENHANNTNVSSYGASGPVGSSSMEFDGSSDYITLPSGFFGGLSTVTVCAWINPDSIPSTSPGHGGASNGDSAIFAFKEGGDDAIFLDIGSDDEVYFYIDNGSNNSITSSSSPISTNSWHMVVGVYDGIKGKGEIYVNGVREGTFSASGSVIDNSGGTYSLGRYYDGSTDQDYFDGKLAHVRVWDYPLPEASIKALYNASKGGFSESDSRTL